MKVGIVTVLYNSETVLKDFFLTLEEQNYKNIILYIVDNNSPDNSYEMSKEYKIKSKYEIKILKNKDNLGVAEGNNIGIKKALRDGCDYVLLANNDIIIKKDSISKLLEKSQEKNKPIVVPKIYYYNTSKIWCAGGKFNKLRGTTIHIGELEEDNQIYDLDYDCDYSPTCFMLIEKKVFEDVGVMDEKYFVYYDDTDFIYRANLKGYKVYYTGETSIEHKVSVSTGGSESLFSIFYGTRNRMYFIKKNLKKIPKIISLSFFFSTRVFKYMFYNKEQRQALMRGIKVGIKY
ncbi:MAG: glycosyltransferase family 2 protein [Cetobacterium sp.]|uniref:glycosyltransferase family 2 protein n=1 Tax=Cetobacterium sp. TaxID=2071632 RepID=UPI003EE6203D